MGICLEKKKAPEEEETKTPRDDRENDTYLEEFSGFMNIEIDNLGHFAKQWLELLALPLPVTVGLLFGGCLGSRLGFSRFMMLMIIFFGIFPPIYRHVMHMIGEKLKAYLEEVDRDYIGVDIEIGEIELCICFARMVIKDLIVKNPPGYKADHMIKCHNLILDLDLLELVTSKGKKVIVEEFTLDNIDVIVEYDSVVIGVGKSNVDWVRDYMAGDKESPRNKKKIEEQSEEEKKTEEEKEAEKEKKKKGKREYILQKVQLVDVGAYFKGAMGLGTRIQLADTRFKHFSKQTKTAEAGDVLTILFKSIHKSLLANVAGRSYANKSA